MTWDFISTESLEAQLIQERKSLQKLRSHKPQKFLETADVWKPGQDPKPRKSVEPERLQNH